MNEILLYLFSMLASTPKEKCVCVYMCVCVHAHMCTWVHMFIFGYYSLMTTLHVVILEVNVFDNNLYIILDQRAFKSDLS